METCGSASARFKPGLAAAFKASRRFPGELMPPHLLLKHGTQLPLDWFGDCCHYGMLINFGSTKPVSTRDKERQNILISISRDMHEINQTEEKILSLLASNSLSTLCKLETFQKSIDHILTTEGFLEDRLSASRDLLAGMKKNRENKNKNLIDNEYYIANNINNLINDGLKVKIMPVDYWINLGDYFGLQQYIYWKNFFLNNIEIRKC